MSPKRNNLEKSRHNSVHNSQLSSSKSYNTPRNISRKHRKKFASRKPANPAPMQAKQDRYLPPAQDSTRRHVVLPPGKNDLEILENLKQIIKNGQHDFYRAIPQPTALASLYLGKIPNAEPTAQTGPSEESIPSTSTHIFGGATQPGASSATDNRPPRLQGKEGFEARSSRRDSTSASSQQREEQAVRSKFSSMLHLILRYSEGLSTDKCEWSPSTYCFFDAIRAWPFDNPWNQSFAPNWLVGHRPEGTPSLWHRTI